MDRAQMPNDEAQGTEFVRLLTAHQRDIYLYVRSLVLSPDAVEEIVQDTNLVLWEKRDRFNAAKHFRPWAFQIARYKISEYRARHKRKCVCFSDILVDELALQAPQYVKIENDLADELLRCIAQLAAGDRELLNQRYASPTSCESIAEALGRPVRWVYNAMNRIRQELLDCMTRHTGAWRER